MMYTLVSFIISYALLQNITKRYDITKQLEYGISSLSKSSQSREDAKLDPRGIVVSGNMLMVTDYKAYNVHLYRRDDAKLLATTGELESRPRGICCINDKEICVALNNGTIEIMSVQYTEDSGVIKRRRKLNVNTAFDECHGVARSMDKVVVSGIKNDMICWCIVYLNDGHIGRVHKVCKGNWSFLTTKDNMIYISCYAGVLSPPVTGVYGYNIQNHSKQTFIYKHKDLDFVNGITVDTQGFLFMCNSSFINSCIHHLTDKGELVSIYRDGIPNDPLDIFWDHGILYITSSGSNVITRYKSEYSHQQGKKQGAIKPTEEGDHRAPEVLGSDERKQPVTGETSTQTEQGVIKDQEGEGEDNAVAPITQEHINHARLCNALTTVCSDALRKILLTQVPATHTDIYQAILANQANLKRLNSDQQQLVFPDPQGRYTGTVDQFDISLLYTIIRNISGVPAPTKGWEKPPADQPRDTTLEASVERIRLYRNIISGHSVDGKISHTEFEVYWKVIDDVLHDIENVIGNRGYLEDLERRKNQIITPHEAHELRKTFRVYKQ